MIIARAPFRISFFGGGTDFPGYYRRHGGAVLATSIDQYAYISLHSLSPFFRYRFRASYAKTELVGRPAEFRHPLIRECLRHMRVRDGLEITHVADLPGRTGLGTSSAFTVALLHALHAMRGERPCPGDLAREAILIERKRVGDAGGHQDQFAAAYGGFLRLDFGPGDAMQVRRIHLPPPARTTLRDRLLLFYLGREDSAEAILAEQTGKTRRNRAALDRMHAMVDEAEAMLKTGAWPAFGALLHEGWELKKTLAGGISSPDIDAAYDVARRAGATGGKLLGAGGRGFLLIMAEPEHQPAIRRRLRALREVRFGFDREGCRLVFKSTPARDPRS